MIVPARALSGVDDHREAILAHRDEDGHLGRWVARVAPQELLASP